MRLLTQSVSEITSQSEQARAMAKERLDQLTMPPWALGRLMDLTMDLCGITGEVPPPIARKAVVVMAADHGVVAQGVSGFPQEVTPQMVHNFVCGGAGINAIARQVDARVLVVDMGVVADTTTMDGGSRVIGKRVGPGTDDMSQGPAMSRDQAVQSIEAGIEVVQSLAAEVDVIGTGDMGIGNTTPSAAIIAAITGRPVEEVTGRGTGIDDKQLAHKVAVIKTALERNEPNAKDGLDVLAKVGGFEIGGIAGLCLGAAALRKPVVIDGVISGAGALIAAALAPSVTEFMIAGHLSVEPGHRHALDYLNKRALLDLDLRLGEGTGAALAMSLMDAAVLVLTDVATFAEAAVSQANP